MLFKDWHSGKWQVDTVNEYILCAVLLLWIPVWLFGICLIYRLWPSRKSASQVIQNATASHPFIPAYTPASMPSQGKSAVLETPSAPSQNNETEGQSAAETDWVPKDAAEAHAIDVISKIAEENGLTPFPHVLLENELIPVTISSDSDACLIKVLAAQGTWQVQMTEPLDQSVWSCNGEAKNVLKEITLGKGILAKMEPNSNVIPVVVLAQGNLENQEATLTWLNQHGVEVVTIPENPQQGLPQLSDILIKYFGELNKIQEENNELDQTGSIQTEPI